MVHQIPADCLERNLPTNSSFIQRVLTDNGSCYRSHRWAHTLECTATAHKRTRPYTPRTNGKMERFDGTLAREWASSANTPPNSNDGLHWSIS